MKFSPFMILVLFTFFAVWLKVTGFLSLSWLMIFMPLIIFSVLINAAQIPIIKRNETKEYYSKTY